ncbi:MAG: imidazolonepropionase, partial [Microbacterium sp.]
MPGVDGSADADSAAVLIEDGRVAWSGLASHLDRETTPGGRAHGGAPPSRRPDVVSRSAVEGEVEVIDVGGRAVVPGFVDSHTHLVFGGDRAEEFEARMSGHRYEAGGIRRTVAATRAATDDQLRARLAGFVGELHAQGTTTFEVKTGYDLTADGEARLARMAAEVTDEVTFLGAHVVPAEYADDRDGYVDLVAGAMLDAVRDHARWIDVFCERGAFTPAETARVLRAGAAAGLGLRVHGNQLGPGDGAALAVALGAASVDHCTY